MPSWWNKKQLGILCGAGLLMAGYLLNVTGVFSGAAKAQPQPANSTPGAVDLPTPAVNPPADLPFKLADKAAPQGTPAVAQAAPASTIEQLVEKLQSLRARKADLERQEKQVVAALKEKLKEQQQRLQKLGINTPPTEAPASVSNESSKPDVGTGSLRLAEPRDGGTKK